MGCETRRRHCLTRCVLCLLCCAVLQSAVFDSQPKSTVGTPAYIAPEVLSRKQVCGESWGRNCDANAGAYLPMLPPRRYHLPPSVLSATLYWHLIIRLYCLRPCSTTARLRMCGAAG